MTESEKKISPVKPSLRDVDTDLSISPLGIVPTTLLGWYLVGMSLVRSYMIYTFWRHRRKDRPARPPRLRPIAKVRLSHGFAARRAAALIITHNNNVKATPATASSYKNP